MTEASPSTRPVARLSCPRCATTVFVPKGERATCLRCGYPGPDKRPAPPPGAQPQPVAFSRQAPGPGGPAIDARGLTKRYPRTTAVDSLSFQVPRGGVVGFVGPNGAGKTTTIRMLLSLIRSTSGTASVLGSSIQHPLRYLPRVGALIESPAFHPQLSGRRNLAVLATLGGHDAARIDPLLALVGLAERGNDPYKSYSLGMKQRLGIAAALLPDPDLLVLDEPTNGLDPAGIREVRSLLRKLGDEGRTVFVSSHLLGEVQRLCDSVVILRQGRLVHQGSVQALLAGQGLGTITARAEQPAQDRQLLAIAQAAGLQARETQDGVEVRAPAAFAPELNRRAMRAGITLAELHVRSADLEETVLGMTGAGKL